MSTWLAKKPLAAAIALAALLPVAAGQRPPCCATEREAPVRPCCTAPVDPTPVGRGCCKSPQAPKPESTSKAAPQAMVAIAIETLLAGPAGLVAEVIPQTVAARLARRDHRSPSPDDSPPDRLAELHLLLI